MTPAQMDEIKPGAQLHITTDKGDLATNVIAVGSNGEGMGSWVAVSAFGTAQYINAQDHEFPTEDGDDIRDMTVVKPGQVLEDPINGVEFTVAATYGSQNHDGEGADGIDHVILVPGTIADGDLGSEFLTATDASRILRVMKA